MGRLNASDIVSPLTHSTTNSNSSSHDTIAVLSDERKVTKSRLSIVIATNLNDIVGVQCTSYSNGSTNGIAMTAIHSSSRYSSSTTSRYDNTTSTISTVESPVIIDSATDHTNV